MQTKTSFVNFTALNNDLFPEILREEAVARLYHLGKVYIYLLLVKINEINP